MIRMVSADNDELKNAHEQLFSENDTSAIQIAIAVRHGYTQRWKKKYLF